MKVYGLGVLCLIFTMLFSARAEAEKKIPIVLRDLDDAAQFVLDDGELALNVYMESNTCTGWKFSPHAGMVVFKKNKQYSAPLSEVGDTVPAYEAVVKNNLDWWCKYRIKTVSIGVYAPETPDEHSVNKVNTLRLAPGGSSRDVDVYCGFFSYTNSKSLFACGPMDEDGEVEQSAAVPVRMDGKTVTVNIHFI